MARNPEDDPRVYAALAIPNAALTNGGVEILRAGIIEDGLHVQARHAFKDPKQWGEVLADIADRVAALYAAETTRSRESVIDAIRQAFFAELAAVTPAPTPRRAPVHKTKPKAKPTKSPATRAAAKKTGKSASKTARKTIRKSKRKR